MLRNEVVIVLRFFFYPAICGEIKVLLYEDKK